MEESDTTPEMSKEGEKVSLCTLKRNPKMDLTKAELLKLLAQMEGELQAQTVVIATLKSEKVKQYLVHTRDSVKDEKSDPLLALQRDLYFSTNKEKNPEMCLILNQKVQSLENLVAQQKQAYDRTIAMLKENEIMHKRQMTLEFQSRTRMELECKKMKQMLAAEKQRHKAIVLYLMAERKILFLKYTEEHKRSEDLAQILAEEKNRVDSMAEGLEEESKKSLKMEADLENQVATYCAEIQKMKLTLLTKNKQLGDLEADLNKIQQLSAECNNRCSCGGFQVDTTRVKDSYDKNAVAVKDESKNEIGFVKKEPVIAVTPQFASPITSIAKVIQPTATVSSVPVSSPLTGIARCVSPGHNTRVGTYANVPVPSKEILSVTTASVLQPDDKSPVYANAVVTNKKQAVPAVRGNPPPVPPNKPVIPPKKDNILGKKMESPCSETKSSRAAAASSVKVKKSDKGEKAKSKSAEKKV